MIHLLKYAKKYRVQMIVGPAAKFIEALFELFLPVLMARLIDKGIHQGDASYIYKMGFDMLIMSIIGVLAALVCQYSASVSSQGFGTVLRDTLMKKIQTFSYKEIDQFGTSTLITRLTTDVNQMQLALAMLIRLVIRAPFLSIGAIIMSIYVSPKLSIIFIVLLPIFLCILAFIMIKSVPLFKKVQSKLDHIALVIGENLSGVRVIRAFARRKKEQERVDEATDDLAVAYRRVANLSALVNPATTLVMNVGIIILLYVSGIQVNIGSLSQGEVLALVNYLIQMLTAMIIVANLVVIFTKAGASASRINEVLDTAPTISYPENEQIQAQRDIQEAIIFDHVDLNYQDAGDAALEQISFSAKSGKVLGIVGTTGSGKSSLIQLIPRFYDATAGTVSLFGQSVKEYTQQQLRSLVNIVPQQSVLFSGTIADNLRFGKADATDEELLEALDIAQSLEFVNQLPEGLDSQVHEGGKNFSGGQKQRLAIARALVPKPAILILDDSLSALDYRTDLELRQALKHKLAGTTLVIVSQRISSIMEADQIVVLDDGKLVGLGTHEALVENCDPYIEIYNSQMDLEGKAGGAR